MSIPAPDYNNGYHNSLRQYSFGDNYGFGSGGNASNPALQSYEQQLLKYISNVRSQLSTLQQGTQNYTLLQNYIQTAYGYLQSVDPQMSMSDPSFAGGSPWDPMGGGAVDPSNPLGDPNQLGPQPAQYGEMIWQDSTRVKWDGTDPVVYKVEQQGEKRQEDFFQDDVTIQIPYHGATAKAELLDDDSASAPAKMLKVTVTMADGSTRVIVKHNLTAKSTVRIESPDSSKTTMDASLSSSPLASQVTISDIANPNETQPQDNPPAEMKGGVATWDVIGDVTMSPHYKDNTIQAKGDVTIMPNSNNEYYSVIYTKGPPPAYDVMVFDGPPNASGSKLKSTIKIDAKLLKKLHFGCDPSRITFSQGPGGWNFLSGDAVLADPSDPDGHTINKTTPEAQKLDFVDQATGDTVAGQPVSQKNAEDTPTDGVTGNTATYNSSKDVDIHADFDQTAVNTYEIDAPGTVTIHGSSYADTMEIQDYKAGPPPTWTILVHKDGKTDAAHTQTFKIKGGANTKINLDVMDQSSIVNSSGAPETDSTKLGSVTIGTGEPGENGNPDTSGDTQPDEPGKHTYTGNGDVTLQAVKCKEDNIINVKGDVKITLGPGQTANIDKIGNDYVITVKDKDGNVIATYKVDKHAKSINIDGKVPDSAVTWTPKVLGANKVEIQGVPINASQTVLDNDAATLQKGSTPSKDQLTLTGTGTDGQVYWDQNACTNLMNWGKKTAKDIGDALQSGDWSAVTSDMSYLAAQGVWQPHYATTLFLLMRGLLGDTPLKGVISQMPSEVKSKWVGALESCGADWLNNPTISSFYSGGYTLDAGWTIQSVADTINSVKSSGDDS